MKEKRYRRGRRRGNVLDLLLILLLLLSLLGVALRWQMLHRTEAHENFAAYRMTLHLSDVDPRLSECIAVGDPVYSSAGELWGSVGAVRVLPTRVTLFSEGKAITGEWDTAYRCDIEVEIAFEGTESDGRVLWNGSVACLIGQNTRLYTPCARLSGRISGVVAAQ